MYKLMVATAVSAALLQGCTNSLGLPNNSEGAGSGDTSFITSIDGKAIKTADGGCLRSIDWDPAQHSGSCESGDTLASLEQTEVPAASVSELDSRPPVTLQQNLSGNALFASGSSSLSPEGFTALVTLIDDIGSLDSAGSVEIIGHTDSSGPEGFNQQLSESRAAVVHDFLKDKLTGLEFSMRGVGESQPIADNGSEDGRAQNRRVEVLVRRDLMN